MSPWYADHENLAELWRWLEEHCDAPEDVAGFLDEPWHWEHEYNQMRAEQARLEAVAA